MKVHHRQRQQHGRRHQRILPPQPHLRKRRVEGEDKQRIRQHAAKAPHQPPVLRNQEQGGEGEVVGKHPQLRGIIPVGREERPLLGQEARVDQVRSHVGVQQVPDVAPFKIAQRRKAARQHQPGYSAAEFGPRHANSPLHDDNRALDAGCGWKRGVPAGLSYQRRRGVVKTRDAGRGGLPAAIVTSVWRGKGAVRFPGKGNCAIINCCNLS